jgi:predicted RNase H-like nuclease
LAEKQTMNITLIGIDCATKKEKVGLARAALDREQVRVEEVATGADLESITRTLAGWVQSAPICLLALDAPLGWPAALGPTLAHHRAGDPIHIPRDRMFSRLTDRVVKREIGKRPLNVGADRIAHTAHAALYQLDELRYETGQPIELAWDPNLGPGIHAIEVYPAATLIAYGISSAGYKGKQGKAARQQILRSLPRHLVLPNDVELLVECDHALDAVLCVLAGADFLQGLALAPEDLPTAQDEGWIWFRLRIC